MADAGTSLGAGHEEQKSQHGKLREASVGLERVEPHPSFAFLCGRLTDDSIPLRDFFFLV